MDKVGYSKTCGGELPSDAMPVKEVGSWSIYVSRSRNLLIIDTTDYHPEPLILSENILCELYEILESRKNV